MALTAYDWLYGIAQISTAILSIVAGYIAISMIHHTRKQKLLGGWKLLIWGLVSFAIVIVLGALKTFGIFSTTFLTHIMVSVVLGFLIAALVIQIQINKGWIKWL